MLRHCYKICLSLFLCIVLLAVGSPAFAAKTRILYFNSENPTVFWWRTSAEILKAACDDLDMDLEVVYVERNPVKMLAEFSARAKSATPPGAVIFQNLRTNAGAMLNIAEKYKIPAFIFNAGLTDEQAAQYGGPREKFKYWIGQMTPAPAMIWH